MKPFLKLALSLALVAFPSLHAANVTYTYYTATGAADTTWVSVAGYNSIVAGNFGGGDTTFGGVTWKGGLQLSGGGVGINYSASGVAWASQTTGFYSGGPALLNAGGYSVSLQASGVEYAINLSGLTVGRDYMVQFVLADNRDNSGHATILAKGANVTGDSARTRYSYTGGRFAVITASFTADATTAAFQPGQRWGDDVPSGTFVSGIRVLGVYSVPNRFVNEGAAADFPIANLSTDMQSHFRLGGAIQDHVAVTTADGLSVAAGATPQHIINITRMGDVAVGCYPLISCSGSIGGLGFEGLKLGPLGALTGRLVNNTANSSIDLEITGDGTYASWENLTGIPGAGPAADSDGDGVPNGIEFVTGGAPGSDTHTLLPQVMVASSGFTFSFRRTDAAVSTANLSVETSEDLAHWTTAQDRANGIAITSDDDFHGAGIDRITAAFPITGSTGPRNFTRLRVDIPDTVEPIVENTGSAPNTVTTLNPRSTTPLMADDATGAAGLSAFNPAPKRIWMDGWKTTQQTLTWQVFAPVEGLYEVELVSMGIPAVRVTGGMDGPLDAVIAGLGWNRNPLGVIRLPQGRTSLRLELSANLASAGALRSLDVLPVVAKPDYQQRVAGLRSETRWIRQKGYGVMLQYGAWGYPPHGGKKPWEQVAAEFDVAEFARMVDEDMGAKWVIWSITWRGSHFPMPLASVDAIVPGHTIQRDLMADLATALKARGIKLMFYYHPGHEDPAWWAANWRDPYHKKQFIDNWIAVMTEIGNRYGDNLAGWFFDDAMCYSPAPFEAMTRAAKSGFPGRLVSYNNWVLPTLTDFQDIQMGEGFTGSDETAVGSDGIYQRGPHQGMQAHGMFCVNSSEWGIWKPETVTPLQVNADTAIGIVKNANRRGQAMSLNFDMYEDGTVTPETLVMFRSLKAAIYAPVPVSEGKPATDSGHWPGNYGADQAVDGGLATFWSLPQNQTSGWMEVDLGVPTAITHAMVHEVITPPRVPLVTQFAIEAKQGDDSWLAISTGAGMGANRNLSFAPVTAQVFRLHILNANHPAGTGVTIGEFQLFE